MYNKGKKLSASDTKLTLFIIFFFLLFYPNSAVSIDLTTADCRNCHGSNVSARHHLLLGLSSYVCMDCHLLSWDQQLSAFVFNNSHDCSTCHTTSVADRHHVSAVNSDYECLSCHALFKDENTQSFYIDFNFSTGRRQVSHYYYHVLTMKNDCTGCHLDNISDEHEGKCEICHSSADQTVRVAVAAGYRECTACHGAPTLSRHLMSCSICHAPVSKEKTGPLHRRHMYSVNCGYCHKVPEKYNLESTGQHCAICHSAARPYNISDVPALHKTHVMGRGFFPYSCHMCHGKAAPQMHPTQCSVCHGDNRPYEASQLQSIHRIHSNYFDCTNCHVDPMDLTAYQASTSCERCHDTRPYSSLFALHGQSHFDKPCWACHPTDELFSRRQNYPQGCVSCHPQVPVYLSKQAVHFSHNGYQCWVCHTTVYPVVPTMRQPLNFSSGSVAGVITDESGTSLFAGKIFTEDGRFLTLSRANGDYSLYNLAPGHYLLRAEKAGYISQSRRLKVVNGQTTKIDFSLATVPFGAASIGGKVLDQSQAAVPGATVTTKSSSGGYTTVTAPDGEYSLTAIGSGSHVVIAAKTGFYSARKTLNIASGQVEPANFILASIPNDVLCTSCHGEYSSKVNCTNKKWKKHIRDGLIDKGSYEKAETTLLGQTCISGNTPTITSSLLFPQDPPPKDGDISVCTGCHADFREKVQCTSKNWKLHLRKKRVDQATYNLAEMTFLGGVCN